MTDVKELVKEIRSEIKLAIKNGTLPSGPKTRSQPYHTYFIRYKRGNDMISVDLSCAFEYDRQQEIGKYLKQMFEPMTKANKHVNFYFG